MTTGFSVQFRKSGRTIVCGADTFILTAATEAGLAMAFRCGKGVCGTCKSDLISGEVDMQAAGGIRPREVAAGKILICCSKPLTDLVIDQ